MSQMEIAERVEEACTWILATYKENGGTTGSRKPTPEHEILIDELTVMAAERFEINYDHLYAIIHSTR